MIKKNKTVIPHKLSSTSVIYSLNIRIFKTLQQDYTTGRTSLLYSKAQGVLFCPSSGKVECLVVKLFMLT